MNCCGGRKGELEEQGMLQISMEVISRSVLGPDWCIGRSELRSPGRTVQPNLNVFVNIVNIG